MGIQSQHHEGRYYEHSPRGCGQCSSSSWRRQDARSSQCGLAGNRRCCAQWIEGAQGFNWGLEGFPKERQDVSAMTASSDKFNEAAEAEMKAVKKLGGGPLMKAHGKEEQAAYADISKQGAKLTGSIDKHSKELKSGKGGGWVQKERAEMKGI